MCGELLRHRFPRDDRPAILDHRAGGQVSASGGGFGIAAGKANGQVAGAEESPAAVVSTTFSLASLTAGTSRSVAR